MGQRLALVLALGALATNCQAEPRWCSVSKRDLSNTLVYPPIAAAAQIQGEVSARILYRPNGQIERVEPLSGAPLLSRTLEEQLAKWTVRTDAPGEELCETLVIATFKVGRAKPEPQKLRKLRLALMRKRQRIKFTLEPNTIRISVSGPGLLIEQVSDDVGAARQAS